MLDETSDIETRPPICLFVAPHEFFTLGRGTDWVRDDVLSEGFMFGTEQVQTTWFNLSLPFILMSRGMLDICTSERQPVRETRHGGAACAARRPAPAASVD